MVKSKAFLPRSRGRALILIPSNRATLRLSVEINPLRWHLTDAYVEHTHLFKLTLKENKSVLYIMYNWRHVCPIIS